jgi:hypothetical protein
VQPAATRLAEQIAYLQALVLVRLMRVDVAYPEDASNDDDDNTEAPLSNDQASRLGSSETRAVSRLASDSLQAYVAVDSRVFGNR